MIKKSILFATSLVIAASSGWAQNSTAPSLSKDESGAMVWQAGIDGATLEFNPDGSIRRIYSKYQHPVSINDKRGVQTATIIAEEKAKANIVRFLNQHVSSSRVVSEFENTASKTIQEKNGSSASVTTTDQRNVVQSLTELTSSFSSGTLTGVVVLENGHSEKDNEVWVVVGLSQKTMAAAKATKEMLSQSQRPGGDSTTSPASRERSNTTIRRGNSDF